MEFNYNIPTKTQYTNLSNDSSPVFESWWSINEDSIDDYDFTSDKVKGKSRLSLQRETQVGVVRKVDKKVRVSSSTVSHLGNLKYNQFENPEKLYYKIEQNCSLTFTHVRSSTNFQIRTRRIASDCIGSEDTNSGVCTILKTDQTHKHTDTHLTCLTMISTPAISTLTCTMDCAITTIHTAWDAPS